MGDLGGSGWSSVDIWKAPEGFELSETLGCPVGGGRLSKTIRMKRRIKRISEDTKASLCT